MSQMPQDQPEAEVDEGSSSVPAPPASRTGADNDGWAYCRLTTDASRSLTCLACQLSRDESIGTACRVPTLSVVRQACGPSPASPRRPSDSCVAPSASPTSTFATAARGSHGPHERVVVHGSGAPVSNLCALQRLARQTCATQPSGSPDEW